jgi:F-type H+-transporting ATPase subunit a
VRLIVKNLDSVSGMGLFNSPLEQFKVIVVVPFSILGFDFSISNVTIYLLLAVLFIYNLFVAAVRDARVLSDPFQRLAEILYSFSNGLVKQQSGIKGLKFFPILFVLFYLILFLNLIGLTPYGFTGTSQASYTFTLGFSMFIGVVLIGLSVQKAKFVNQFIPATTGPIVPLLVVIEIFSYCIRPVSLSIRLFANMLAGHTLLHIIAGFAVSLFKVDTILGFLMLLPIVAVCVLEFGIAFLQAYVFVVLLAIYLKESCYGAGH